MKQLELAERKMTEEREGGMLEHATHKLEDAAGGLVGRAGAAMTDKALDFVKSAAVSDMYEIKAGHIAAKRGQREEVRAAGEQMVRDHTDSSTKLKALLTPDLYDAWPAALDTRRETMLQHLQQVSLEDFDSTYLDQQIMAHKEAVTLMHHFRDNGDNDALRSFASETSPIIEGHLDHMKALAS